MNLQNRKGKDLKSIQRELDCQMADFSPETMEAKNWWNGIFEVLLV